LAIQRQDYNKAYNYLSDSIESKPDFDHFAVEVDRSSGDRRNTLQIREIRLKQDDLAEIDLHLENYTSTSYGTDNDTIYLQLESNGDGWKIVEFTRPYWNYDWNEPGREVVISQAIELDPDNASLYYERGKIYANEDNYKQAQTDFDKVIELDPAYTAAYSARGDVYAHYEDYQLAIANYNKAIELKPNGDLYVRRGSAYYASGNREQASLDFSKAVELASTPVIGHNNVAWALAYDLDTNYETALEHALRSVELDPQAYNHDTLALVYYKLKQYEKAVEHYDISLSLDAEYVGSYKRRGDAYLALGNKQAALTDYQTYVAKSKWPPRSDRTAVEIIIRSLQED
jgi:tetratricopeptide (TPR) repeat protein